MEQIYNLSVTLDELSSILKNEFGFSDDGARVAAVVLIRDQDQNQQETKKQLDEESLLLLGGDSEKCQTHIFSTRYTICFTDAILETLKSLLLPIVLEVFGVGEIAVLEEVIDGISNLARSSRKITDNECCVYYQALRYLKSHKGKWFAARQVMPEIGEDKICVNLDQSWGCRFRTGESCENCSITLESVKCILDGLCEASVMESGIDGNTYRFKF